LEGLSPPQREVVSALRRCTSREYFLPGDVVTVSSLAAHSEPHLLKALQDCDADAFSQKLAAAGLTPTELRSESLATERLAGLPLGLRKRIASWLEREHAPVEVADIKDSGVYTVGDGAGGARDAHYCFMSLVDSGPLYRALAEMGFCDREAIAVALDSLGMRSFHAKEGLNSDKGQRLLDVLTGGDPAEADNPDPQGKIAAAGSSLAAEAMLRARELVDDYVSLLACLRRCALSDTALMHVSAACETAGLPALVYRCDRSGLPL
jgi:hypothetical protein